MKLDRHLLVRLFGFRGALLHGDSMTSDRWRFLRRRLPRTRNGETLLDAGCGSGTFTLGAARRGYRSMGLSWDERNQATANARAQICGVPETSFPVQDLRTLDLRDDLKERFDFIINCENIEHILDDRKVMRDLAACLKPGGRLLFTAPYYFYKPLSVEDQGPFSEVEDGGHVRRGYTEAMLRELCDHAGLVIEEITTCSGFVSQRLTRMHRFFGRYGSAAIMPFRFLAAIFDPPISALFSVKGYSICMMAYKPRFAAPAPVARSVPQAATVDA